MICFFYLFNIFILINRCMFFCLLILDTQRDPDFCIVARVEAFIAGWGLEEALKRSHAYADAGADAILMHSKRKEPSEIKAFLDAWNNKVILFCVNVFVVLFRKAIDF